MERLVRARPAMGSTRHVGWYRALDDDLAALRATLQHTLVEAPSAAGVAVAARLGSYWAFSGMGLEGGRWMRRRGPTWRPTGAGRRAERAAVRIESGGPVVQGRVDEGRDQSARASPRRGCYRGRRRTGVLLADGGRGNAVARAGDRDVLGELTDAMRRTAAGSAALDVAVRLVELVNATVTGPDPELVPRYLALTGLPAPKTTCTRRGSPPPTRPA